MASVSTASGPPFTAPPAPAPASSPSGRQLDWPLLAAVAAAVVAAVVVGVVVLGGGGDGGSSTPDPRAQAEADSQAIADVRTVQTALEAWSVDNAGSYAGADQDDLAKVERSVAGMSFELTTSKDTYTITSVSEVGGNTFTLSREPTGGFTNSCTEAGTGGCKAGGSW